MAVTLADFVKRYPEFKPLSCSDEGFVRAVLDEAAKVINPASFGDQTDRSVMLYAAHQIAISPCGLAAGLSVKGESPYGGELDMAAGSATIGCRVA